MFTIAKVYHIPFLGFESLKQASIKEGYRFVERLEREWIQGDNQFSRKGEALYQVIHEGGLAGIGGITLCPYHSGGRVGRLRRFYISDQMRRQGIGSHLVNHILKQAKPYFKEIVLYTDTHEAALFYEKLGFHPIANQVNVSHRWPGQPVKV